MKTTKKHIRLNTKTTAVVNQNYEFCGVNYRYVHKPYMLFESIHNNRYKVYLFEGNYTFELGTAATKKEFVEIVYDILNR